MKKLFLFLSIIISSYLIHAQRQVANVSYMNIKTSVSEADSIYNGHNYDYYKATYKKATKLRNTGIVLTTVGVGLFVGALIASNTNLNTTTVLFFSSVGSLSLGATLWIVGSVKRKNKRKAMAQIKRNKSLSFGTTNNGVGLVFNF